MDQEDWEDLSDDEALQRLRQHGLSNDAALYLLSIRDDPEFLENLERLGL